MSQSYNFYQKYFIPYKSGPCDVKTLYNTMFRGAITNFPKCLVSVIMRGICEITKQEIIKYMHFNNYYKKTG